MTRTQAQAQAYRDISDGIDEHLLATTQRAVGRQETVETAFQLMESVLVALLKRQITEHDAEELRERIARDIW